MAEVIDLGVKTTNPPGEELKLRVVPEFGEVGLIAGERGIYIRLEDARKLLQKLKEVI